ncbi:hypothetical protein V8F33_005442 [Rhypophila sp. PSN 637]
MLAFCRSSNLCLPEVLIWLALVRGSRTIQYPSGTARIQLPSNTAPCSVLGAALATEQPPLSGPGQQPPPACLCPSLPPVVQFAQSFLPEHTEPGSVDSRQQSSVSSFFPPFPYHLFLLIPTTTHFFIPTDFCRATVRKPSKTNNRRLERPLTSETKEHLL